MLVHEFIPVLHMPKEYRVDFEEFKEDSLSEQLGFPNKTDLGFSGEEEYDNIKSHFAAEFKESHMQILLELIAGAFSISFFEKIAVARAVIEGRVPEYNQYNLIDIFIEERDKFFLIFLKIAEENPESFCL